MFHADAFEVKGSADNYWEEDHQCYRCKTPAVPWSPSKCPKCDKPVKLSEICLPG